MKLLAIACAVFALGCGKHHAPKSEVPAAGIISGMKTFADQACACGTDMQCLHEMRDRFDAQKATLVANPSFTPADVTALGAERQRLGMCGDAGGVTIW